MSLYFCMLDSSFCVFLVFLVFSFPMSLVVVFSFLSAYLHVCVLWATLPELNKMMISQAFGYQDHLWNDQYTVLGSALDSIHLFNTVTCILNTHRTSTALHCTALLVNSYKWRREDFTYFSKLAQMPRHFSRKFICSRPKLTLDSSTSRMSFGQDGTTSDLPVELGILVSTMRLLTVPYSRPH